MSLDRSKIKVCHLTSVHIRYDVRVFQKECISIADSGYNTYLIVNDDKPDEIKNNVKIISTGYKPKSRFDRFINANKIVYKKAIQINADIYHLHDPELLLYALKLKKNGKKVVFDSHEIYYYQIKLKKYIPKLFRNIVAYIYKTYEKYVLSKLDAVIVPCTINGGQNYFDKIAKKTVFINNYPKKDLYKPVDYSDKKEFVMCHAGSLTKERGIEEIIKLSHISKTKVIIGGKFDYNEYKDICDYVDYRGYLDNVGMQDMFNESSLGLSLIHCVGQYSIADNLPTKVYEYMLVGIPFVIQNNRTTKEFVKKYDVGTCVAVDNMNEIENVVNYYKNNPEVSKKKGNLGRDIILKKFNWENEAKRLIELYERM